MTNRRSLRRFATGAALLLAFVLTGVIETRSDEPVVTTLADYEDDSVAAYIADVDNVLAEDCRAVAAAIPARGHRSLMVEIGATKPHASAACDLRFRLATPFDQADRVATYAWINEGSVEIVFRIRDAAGHVFETASTTLETRHRWIRVAASLSPSQLRLVAQRTPPDDHGPARPTWPIQIQGYRIRTAHVGRQPVYLDDLEVEHRATGAAVLRGEFKLDASTHIYEPGALVRAAVVLENTSRGRALPLTVQLAWLRFDGSELTSGRASVNLPARGTDYRSRQPVDFSQPIDEPGLYRLVARIRGTEWNTPAVFETTIAVTRTNRALPRGRATFFGVQTNLILEPLADQLLEIDVASEIGVQLLALETPWRLVESRRDAFDFGALDRVVNLITARGIATMIVLTEPPGWLTASRADPWSRQAVLLEALANHFGKRVLAYQTVRIGQADNGPLTAADFAAIGQIASRVATVQPHAEVFGPPLSVAARTADFASLVAASRDANVQLAFQTAGDSESAVGNLHALARDHSVTWQQSHRWFHRAEALTDSGARHDAVAILRHYVQAAAAGVGGVVWFDLRDDTNDPRHPEQMKGLVRRDFSPKAPLLGFANAVGMLHGLLYAGQLAGTPPQFESALFIAGNRQVAVLFPRPNRVLPAALAPLQLVPGELGVFGFDRRQRPLIRSAVGPLVETSASPFFITLDTWRAQSEPKLALARPWLRLPSVVHCGPEATLPIEIDAPVDLHRSYLQVVLPSDAPVKSSLSARAVRADAGDTLSFNAALTRASEAPFEPATLTVHVSLEGDSVRVPVQLHSLYDVRPYDPRADITDEMFLIGHLLPSAPTNQAQDEAQLSQPLYAAYRSGQLYLAIGLPPEASPRACLQLGVAAENADGHAEARIEHLAGQPALSPDHGTGPRQVRGWHCRRLETQRGVAAACRITIPVASLGLPRLDAERRLLLAVRYFDPQPAGQHAPVTLEWGSGLGGTRSSAHYQWIRLAPSVEGR